MAVTHHGDTERAHQDGELPERVCGDLSQRRMARRAERDAPTVTVAPATGGEDSPIALGIDVALTDSSETISNITISGVPNGATLSAGTDNGNGTWTLTPAQLQGLSITPPVNSDADFTLTVAATSSEGGTSATTTQTLSVTVNAVADAPTVTVAPATGAEDSPISLGIDVALTDASETISNIKIGRAHV